MLLEQLTLIPIEQDGVLWFLLLGSVFLIPLVWFIIGIVLCIWVYRDAEKRGMSGVMWLIIVLITSFIGLIIYLVVRKDKSTGQARPPPTPS